MRNHCRLVLLPIQAEKSLTELQLRGKYGKKAQEEKASGKDSDSGALGKDVDGLPRDVNFSRAGFREGGTAAAAVMAAAASKAKAGDGRRRGVSLILVAVVPNAKVLPGCRLRALRTG